MKQRINLKQVEKTLPFRGQFERKILIDRFLSSSVKYFLVLFSVLFTTCEMPDRDNPWDEKASVDASGWSADGFQIQDVNLTSKKLSWTYQGDNRIEGFQIDRKIGAGEWQEEVYFAGKDERQWVDTNILPDSTKTYTYRLTAVAGVKKSNVRTGTVSVRFPGPTALSLQASTDTTFLLSWTYSSNGHEGFKIDRRKDNENWQLAYKFVNNTQTSVEDKFTSGSDYFYKVYAYYKEFNSSAVTDSLIFPKLTTASLSSISSATAISGGTVTRGTAISARGICWSTSQNPTVSLSSKTTDGSGLGNFVSSLSGLQPGTTYYVRAYATNAMGTGYGNQISFTSSSVLAAISTTAVSAITVTTAQSGGTISSDGGAAITARGVCWSTSQNPTVDNTKTLDGSGAGSFTSTITGLQPGTTYFVRAYATSLIGTAYGVQVSFTTSSTLATLSTTAVSSVTSSSALSGGTISSDGGAVVTARGICWSTSQTPTVSLSTKTTDGSGTGSFVSAMSGLQPGTTYYVRAYATNSHGTAYGNQVNFTTSSVLATISTTPISSITATTAESGGTISSDGGAAITARGVCWSTAQNPTVDDNKTLDGSGTGSFNSSLTGLKPGTTYYVRAYATSIIGTAYGSQQSFTTTSTLPTLSTTDISEITSISAQSGGTITADGGAAITARGVVWSTTQNPTISSGSKTSDGSGAGSFTSSITGLTASTTYYVRAYATNSAGTAYGNQQSFTTTETSTAFETVLNPATGKTWMDRNLGASRVAQSSTDELAYGDLYQWGRGTDGHEKRNSLTTTTLSNGDVPGHGKFILSLNEPYDWRSPHNDNLWQGVNGVNNPCPEGFRMPTSAEWEAERLSWSYNNYWGAFVSPLKLTKAGSRSNYSGTISFIGTDGSYWSSNVRDASVGHLGFSNNNAYVSFSARAFGNSIRCIKDQGENDLPSVTTTSLSEITSTSALSGGSIISDGGTAVTVRGVVWSTSQNPTVNLSAKTSDGYGIGTFTSTISGLQPGTTYYVRAYATSLIGTAYGEQVSFTTSSTLATLNTTAVSSVTASSALSGGTITADGGAAITARGVVWSTTQNPTISLSTKTTDGSGTGAFVSSISGLQPGTTYYIRAYATNSVGTAYGSQVSFTTISITLPSLTTLSVSNITSTAASSGGSISSDGGASVTARGVVWSTSQNPTISLSTKTTDGSGTGAFVSSISGLQPGTTYYIRAYATNSVGTAYGTQVSFTTISNTVPSLTTLSVSNITSAAASSGGIISSDGGATVTARGVCWSTSQDPTVSLSTKTNDGSGSGAFTSSISGLQPGTTYYIRAYATNSVGTAYGSQVSFTTISITVPLLTTLSVSNITSTAASSGGNISSDGGASITARGVVWSTSQNPTVSLSPKTNDGSGSGAFTSSISGLQPGTTYYIRAYANNSVGTAYGSQVSFTTTPASTVSTVTSPTGKIWMDRNLGASRVATSSTDDQAYGDFYQWGRGADGHEKRTSHTTTTLSVGDIPGHGKFITTDYSPVDWRSPQNNNLWQGVNGINNPCPEGFRIPTAAELDTERGSWSSNKSTGAFASPLRLNLAGGRDGAGFVNSVGSVGSYWSSTVDGLYSQYLFFYSSNANIGSDGRCGGLSVRCIKD